MNIETIASHVLSGVGLGNLTVIFFAIVSLIQISPIKIDPWSKLFKWIGKSINGEVMDEIKSIKDDLNNIHDEMEKEKTHSRRKEADAARNRILRFDDELRRKVDHSEEFFNQILEDINTYESFCSADKGYENARANGAIAHIKKVHEHCRNTNTFI